MWNAECGMTAGRAEKKHFCDMQHRLPRLARTLSSLLKFNRNMKSYLDIFEIRPGLGLESAARSDDSLSVAGWLSVLSQLLRDQNSLKLRPVKLLSNSVFNVHLIQISMHHHTIQFFIHLHISSALHSFIKITRKYKKKQR